MTHLERFDQSRVEAAQGWIGLGDFSAAAAELEKVSPAMRQHPAVLAARVQFFEADGRWGCAVELAQEICRLDPQSAFGWVHQARALRALGRAQEAWPILLAVAGKFPDDATVEYEIACLACRLGDFPGAWWWLEKALYDGETDEVRKSAIQEDDLKRLWPLVGDRKQRKGTTGPLVANSRTISKN